MNNIIRFCMSRTVMISMVQSLHFNLWFIVSNVQVILTLVPFSCFFSILCCFYARKQNASRVFAIVWASVCLSVRPSVTLVICIKTVQARITKSLLWAALRSLVYCDKISCHWVQGFSSNEGIKERYPLKMSFCRYWLELCENGCR